MKNFQYEHEGYFRMFQIDPSACGYRVAKLIEEWVGGFHHFPGGESAIKRIDWKNPYWIEIVVYGSLASNDFYQLTKLVLLAHEHAIRVEVGGASNNYLRILFHPKDREDHPTIEQRLASWNQHYRGTT